MTELDYEPLFKPDYYNITVNKINEIFVFTDSSIRKLIARRLQAFLTELEEAGLVFDWPIPLIYSENATWMLEMMRSSAVRLPEAKRTFT